MVTVAELVFFSGTMDCGKSTLALQMEHNHSQGGRRGLIFTKLDRAGESILSSRLGLKTLAIEVTDDLDFWDAVVEQRTHGGRINFLVCDEAQFYLPSQVEQPPGAGAAGRGAVLVRWPRDAQRPNTQRRDGRRRCAGGGR